MGWILSKDSVEIISLKQGITKGLESIFEKGPIKYNNNGVEALTDVVKAQIHRVTLKNKSFSESYSTRPGVKATRVSSTDGIHVFFDKNGGALFHGLKITGKN